MDDALVEKVARAIADDVYSNFEPEQREEGDHEIWLTAAEAAINVIAPDLRLAGVKERLEMAAKVARDHRASRDMPVPAIDYDQACDDIAAGIDALVPRP